MTLGVNHNPYPAIRYSYLSKEPTVCGTHDVGGAPIINNKYEDSWYLISIY